MRFVEVKVTSHCPVVVCADVAADVVRSALTGLGTQFLAEDPSTAAEQLRHLLHQVADALTGCDPQEASERIRARLRDAGVRNRVRLEP